MSKWYGVTIASYGGASWAHAALTLELARRGVPIVGIHGAPYPEMARAEQVRQALASDVKVLVFIDSHIDIDIDDVQELAREAQSTGEITVREGFVWESCLECAAVPRSVLEAVVAEETRRYSNSAVDTSWSGKTVAAVPVASPWNRDGSPLTQGSYLTADEAFITRALHPQTVNAEIHQIALPSARSNRRLIQYRAFNVTAPITDEPGSRFALSIPSFGTLDHDQIAAVYQLEKMGMTIFGIHDCPWIDQARSWLAEKATALGKGVFFLDHDIQFMPNDVLRLCEQALERDAVVAGAYCMRRSGKSIIGAFDMPPGKLPWFKGGGTFPALYSGLGFATIPAGILAGIDVPLLWSHALSTQIRPWFALDCSTGFYAGEDVSFCNRVADLTVRQKSGEEWELSHSGRPARVFIDTRVRIAHRGVYDYGIEDVGLVVPRVEALETVMLGSKAEAREALQSALDLPVETQLEQLTFEKEPMKADYVIAYDDDDQAQRKSLNEVETR